MNELTEEQNEIIGEKFDGLMNQVFELIDELYEKGEDNLTAGEQKFFNAFHEYIWAFPEESENEENLGNTNVIEFPSDRVAESKPRFMLDSQGNLSRLEE